MKTIIFLLSLLLFACATTPPPIPPSYPIQVCDKIWGEIDYKYCFYRVGQSPDVIIFLHGALGSHKSWHSSKFSSFKHFLELQSIMGDERQDDE